MCFETLTFCTGICKCEQESLCEKFSFRCVLSLTASTRAVSRTNQLDVFCVSTERAMGKGRVARELCPVATAEAHAGAGTFLREKQNQFVQRKYGASPQTHRFLKSISEVTAFSGQVFVSQRSAEWMLHLQFICIHRSCLHSVEVVWTNTCYFNAPFIPQCRVVLIRFVVTMLRFTVLFQRVEFDR